MENARHLNLALLGGRKGKNPLSLITAEHLRSALKAARMGTKTSPTTRAGAGSAMLILAPWRLGRRASTEPPALARGAGAPSWGARFVADGEHRYPPVHRVELAVPLPCATLRRAAPAIGPTKAKLTSRRARAAPCAPTPSSGRKEGRGREPVTIWRRITARD